MDNISAKTSINERFVKEIFRLAGNNKLTPDTALKIAMNHEKDPEILHKWIMQVHQELGFFSESLREIASQLLEKIGCRDCEGR